MASAIQRLAVPAGVRRRLGSQVRMALPYRIDRLLNEAKRLRRIRREDLLGRRTVTPKDADSGLEKASAILRTLEADGLLSVEVLDEFDHSIRFGIRALIREIRPKTLVFNDMAPRLLHGRVLRNRHDGNVVRGMSAVAMLAIEERLTIAVRHLLVEHFKEDHAAIEPDYDLGEHRRVLDIFGSSDMPFHGNVPGGGADGGGDDRISSPGLQDGSAPAASSAEQGSRATRA